MDIYQPLRTPDRKQPFQYTLHTTLIETKLKVIYAM